MEAIEKNNINVVICHFQFSAAIKKQPAHVGLFNGTGTYQMSLDFTRSERLHFGSGVQTESILGSHKNCGTRNIHGARKASMTLMSVA